MGASVASVQVAIRPNEEAATSRLLESFEQGSRLPAPMSVSNGLLARFWRGRVRVTEHFTSTTLVPLMRPAHLDVLHDRPPQLGR